VLGNEGAKGRRRVVLRWKECMEHGGTLGCFYERSEESFFLLLP
jgi:hypothetical protein